MGIWEVEFGRDEMSPIICFLFFFWLVWLFAELAFDREVREVRVWPVHFDAVFNHTIF